MRAICLLFVVVLAPLAAAQDMGSVFHCTVKGVHSLNMKGKLVRNANASANIKGARFTVERGTGKITAEFYTNHSPTVLWNGTESGTPTAYLAEDVVVGATGAAFSVFQLLRNESKNLRPFIWHLPTVSITGLCK